MVQFALLALVWGASFLFIKVGLEGLSPGQVVLARLACGSFTLLLICAVTRQPMPRGRTTWLHLFAIAILVCVVPFLLFSWAELHISSGLASIYNATTPLMTTLFAMVALRSEPLTRARATGLLRDRAAGRRRRHRHHAPERGRRRHAPVRAHDRRQQRGPHLRRSGLSRPTTSGVHTSSDVAERHRLRALPRDCIGRRSQGLRWRTTHIKRNSSEWQVADLRRSEH